VVRLKVVGPYVENENSQAAKLVNWLLMLRTIMCTSFKVKISKVKVTRLIAIETESVSYLSNGKAYKLQNWHADRACAINCHGQI